MKIVPITQKEAKAFIDRHHRHMNAARGSVFQVAAEKDGEVVGVAMCGRPVARNLHDGWTLEVNRMCTDGTRNACSFLYAACWRVARNLGYRKVITYILESEPGTSLFAVDWKLVGKTKAASWNCKSRPRVDLYPLQNKLRFEQTN